MTPIKKRPCGADRDTMPFRRRSPMRATSGIDSDLDANLDRSNARRVLVGLLVLGLAITAAATWWSMQRHSRTAAEDLASNGELLVFGTEELLEDAERQIAAGGSLFRSSEHVSGGEFHTFVEDIGLMPGIVGMGYVPLVPDEQLADWVAAARAEVPDLTVFELNGHGLPSPIQTRPLRFPLMFFEPFELFSGLVGLDLGYHEGWYRELAGAADSSGVTMTAFGNLGLAGPLDGPDQFLIGWPIEELETGEVDSIVVALVNLGMLIENNVSDEITAAVDWQVTDVTGGATPGEDTEGSWIGTLDFGNRTWAFTVTPANLDDGLLSGNAIYPFFGGIAVTILLATIGQLAVGRSSGRRKVETLESLNAAKDEFLAAVSHRLRTPLTAVVGFSEVLKDSHADLSDMDRSELLSTIAVQSIELGHLFDNLLTVTRDANRAIFSPSRVNAATELHTVLDTMEPARRAKVRVVAADPEVNIAGDAGLLRQIVRNLLANATEFGAQAELSVIDDNHVARIVVRDNGPGVGPDREQSIFDLYGASSDDRGQPQSMGVGLFVSRRLARRMSGDIIYRRIDSWTVFELSLPALHVAVPVAPVRATVAAR